MNQNFRRKRRRRRTGALISLLLFLAGAFWVTGGKDYFIKEETLPAQAGSFNPEELPAYSGSPFCIVNGNIPFFKPDDLTEEAFENYGEHDSYGRCTAAFACVGPETLPEGEREELTEIRPTGWHNTKYEGIDREYLYNRCHLIGWQLTGENANTRNLITGTRYLNVEGMLPYENAVGRYVRETGHHVMYRSTPVFSGSNLVASGVLLEGRSVEDPEIEFCVYCYNVQPGIEVDYATGESRRQKSP